MTAKTGCMVIDLDEARLVLKALSGEPLLFGEYEALARLEIRMRGNIARQEKTRIVREICPEYGIVDKEYWEVMPLD